MISFLTDFVSMSLGCNLSLTEASIHRKQASYSLFKLPVFWEHTNIIFHLFNQCIFYNPGKFLVGYSLTCSLHTASKKASGSAVEHNVYGLQFEWFTQHKSLKLIIAHHPCQKYLINRWILTTVKEPINQVIIEEIKHKQSMYPLSLVFVDAQEPQALGCTFTAHVRVYLLHDGSCVYLQSEKLP